MDHYYYFKHWWLAGMCYSLNLTTNYVPVPVQATATERTCSREEEDSRGGLELNVTLLRTQGKRFRMLAVFSKERLAVFTLGIKLLHVFQFYNFMLMILSLLSFPHRRKSQFSIEMLPKSEWAFWRNKTGQHWSWMQRRNLHLWRSKRSFWKYWENCKYLGNFEGPLTALPTFWMYVCRLRSRTVRCCQVQIHHKLPLWRTLEGASN